MVDVFVSYKREDRPRVDRLVGLLSDLDLKVWHDASLEAGEDWQQRIEAVARRAGCVVVCWTEAAAASQWVRAELEIGRSRGVLAPVRFEPCPLPQDLAWMHWPDLSDWTDGLDHPGIRGLVDGVERVLKCGLPARLQQRIGGQNPDVVAKLRTLLVRIARTGGAPITYQQAHDHVASLWVGCEEMPMTALFGALDAIADQNRSRREPPLFGLVVGAEGLPGRGYFQKHCFLAGGTTDEARFIHAAHLRRVYGYSWPHDPPDPGGLLEMMVE